MSEQNKRLQLLSQEDVAYTPVSIRRGEACAACRWYGGGYCHLVMSEPQAIEPTGYCNRFEAAPVPEIPDATLLVEGDVTVVQMEERQAKEGNNRPGEGVASETSESKMPGGGILGAIKNWFGAGGDVNLAQGVFKALGDGYWLAAHTNNLQDLEGEILTEKAHRRYIARVQKGFVEMPDLWLKHIKGTRHGKALWVWMDGHMVGAVGKFDDTPIGHAMEKYYRKCKPGDIQLSHGFSFPKLWGKKGNVYEDYNTFEITTIPVRYGRGANPYTAFEEVMTMALSEADRKMLEEILPADIAPRVVEWNDKQAGKLKELVDAGGVAFKGLFDFVDTTDKEEKPNGDAQKAMGALVSDLSEGQATVLDVAEQAVKAVAALKDRMEKRDAEWQAKLAAEQEARKVLEAKLDNKPRRVDDADAGNQVEGKEADAAAEELDKMKGEEHDPHYPGMKIPKKS